jgi:hypothetical protein
VPGTSRRLSEYSESMFETSRRLSEHSESMSGTSLGLSEHSESVPVTSQGLLCSARQAFIYRHHTNYKI